MYDRNTNSEPVNQTHPGNPCSPTRRVYYLIQGLRALMLLALSATLLTAARTPLQAMPLQLGVWTTLNGTTPYWSTYTLSDITYPVSFGVYSALAGKNLTWNGTLEVKVSAQDELVWVPPMKTFYGGVVPGYWSPVLENLVFSYQVTSAASNSPLIPLQGLNVLTHNPRGFTENADYAPSAGQTAPGSVILGYTPYWLPAPGTLFQFNAPGYLAAGQKSAWFFVTTNATNYAANDTVDFVFTQTPQNALLTLSGIMGPQ